MANTTQINLGAFYTSAKLVDYVYSLLQSNVKNLAEYILLDTACGDGALLNHSSVINNKKIGNDVEQTAIESVVALENMKLYNQNALMQGSRAAYKLSQQDKLIIVANPPYNDVTSQYKQKIKEVRFQINEKYKANDLGRAFLKSYVDLDPEYLCVLHPLSYLIKKSNFNSLKEFKDNYELIDCLIVSSAEFENTSKAKVYFPIIIALYKKAKSGMDFDYISNFKFKTADNTEFSLDQFSFINQYIDKYPNKKNFPNPSQAKAMFYTLRDINALKRSATFIKVENCNTIFVSEDKYKYYCYINVFKKYLDKIPYYFGNLDIPIDINSFSKIEQAFISCSESNQHYLEIDNYFMNLFKGHYVTDSREN